MYVNSKEMQSTSSKDSNLEKLKLFLQGLAVFFGACHEGGIIE